MKKLLLVFMCAVCVLAACNKGPNPKESLIETGNALQNCDADNIDRYIDISSILNNAIDVVARQEIQGLSKEEIVGLTAAKVIVVPIAKQFIMEGIRELGDSEYKDYIKLIKVKQYEILENKNGYASAKVILDNQEVIKYALDKNLVSEEVKPYLADPEVLFILEMKQSGKYWQITKISNLEEIIKKYAPLYEEQMKKEEFEEIDSENVNLKNE